MLIAKSFSGPRAALLWQYLHCFEWFFVLGLPASALIGYMATRPSDPDAFFLVGVFLLPSLIFEALRSEQGMHAFQRRLPVAVETTVQAELAAVLIVILWLLVGFGLGCWLSGLASGLPTPWIVPATVALGVLGLVLKRANESLGGGPMAIGLGAVVLAAIIITLIVLEPLSARAGHVVGDYVLMAASALLAVGAGYRAAVYCARLARYRDRHQRPGSILYVELAGTPNTRHPRANTALTRPEAVAFQSCEAAQRWYDWQFFRRFEFWTTMFWSCCVMQFLYGWFLMESLGTSDTPFADYAFIAGVIILTIRFNWTWEDASAALPLSDWSRSRYFLKLAATILVTGCALLWILNSAWAAFTIKMPIAAALDPSPYIAALWVAWAGLALGPGMYLGLLLLSVWSYFLQPPHIESIVLAVCLTWMFSPVILRRNAFSRAALGDVLLALGATAVAFAGYVVMGRVGLSPLVHWTLREAIGITLVSVLLRHYLRFGTMPAATAGRLRNALLLSGATAWAAVVLWGPFEEPDRGVMAIFLGLGYIPPLFFPLMMLPHYFTWMRASADKHKEARRKMPWML